MPELGGEAGSKVMVEREDAGGVMGSRGCEMILSRVGQ